MTRRNADPGKERPQRLARGQCDAPAYHRNIGPILDVLTEVLAGKSGHVLEIGSGTGQHITRFADTFPMLSWWPSDPDPIHRKCICAWADTTPAQNLHHPLNLDASATDWGLGNMPDRPPSALAAIICCNVFHIAPWNVAQGVINGAARYLAADGILMTYGPYRHGGEHTAQSNADFDAALRARDPAWGVRDIADIDVAACAAGLYLKDIIAMPANNMVLLIARNKQD